MNNLDTDLQARLTKLAYKRTIPYCHGCNTEARGGRCSGCGPDDLMRLLPGEGLDWGVDWVISAIIRENLKAIDTEEVFEDSVRGCYPDTTKIGWLEYDTISAVKELDPVSWNMAVSEWLSNEEDEGLVASFDGGSHYFSTRDIETFLNEQDLADVDVIEPAG